MSELFANQALLRSSDLRLAELSLLGVPYGCEAKDFPVEKVCQVTLAPIVKSSSWSQEAGTSYHDANGQVLHLSEVIANAMQEQGVLHFAENVSFGFRNGRVFSFALYGKALNVLQHIRSYTQFLNEFGTGDAISIKEAFGDLMGYEHYYQQCNKLAEWDEMGKKIVVINFGLERRGQGVA